MEDRRNALWESTALAHKKIQQAAFDLQNIAGEVSYLHPNLADKLEMIAGIIEKNRRTIQGDAAEKINLDLKDSQRSVGEMLVALIDNCESVR